MPCAIFGTHTRHTTPHQSENIRAWEQMRDRKLLTRMYCTTRVGKALSIDRKIEIVLDTRAHSYVSVVVGKYLQHKPEMYAVRTQSANGAFPFLIKPIYFSLDWYNDDFYGSRARSNVRDHLICFLFVSGASIACCALHKQKERAEEIAESSHLIVDENSTLAIQVYAAQTRTRREKGTTAWYGLYFWFSSRFFLLSSVRFLFDKRFAL